MRKLRKISFTGAYSSMGLLLLSGCSQTLKSLSESAPMQKMRTWVAELSANFGDEPTFKASNGNYFPEVILSAFPNAKEFSKTHPTTALAGAGVQLVEVRPLTPNPGGVNEANLSWSNDGGYLGFEVTSLNERKILLADLSGKYKRELSVTQSRKDHFLEGMVAPSTHSYNAGLRWSSRGRRFTFMSNGGKGTYNIYVGAIGASEKAITDGSAKDGYATWSPKSSEIAFVSSRTGSGDIYLVNADSKSITQLTNGPEVDIFPEWSGEGDAIAFSSGDALRHEIALVRRDARGAWTKARLITNWGKDSLRPTFSPDGNWLAFYSIDGNATASGTEIWNLHVVSARGGEGTPKSRREDSILVRDVVVDLNTGPAWTPDGKRIILIKRDPERFNPIYVYDIYSGQETPIITGTKMNRDLMMSKLGVLSFRAQSGAWDKVYIALTNLGVQLQERVSLPAKIHYAAQSSRDCTPQNPCGELR